MPLTLNPNQTKDNRQDALLFSAIEKWNDRAKTVPVDRDEGHPGMYTLGAAVTILSIAGYVAPFFIAFPLAAPIQIIALGVLTAVTYGIINDQIACRQCIHYFTVGHTPFHKRLLKTDDPTLNGIVWGIHATWVLGLAAGVAMAVAATATSLVALSALHLTPVALLLVIGACVYAHRKSKEAEKEWSKPEQQDVLNATFQQTIYPQSGYHAVDLRRVPNDKRAAYMAVGERNRVGYKVMPIAGLAIVLGTIAVRILLAII